MRTSAVALSLVSLTALGCASTGPTPELLDARRAYEAARVAPEVRYTPERVLEAKRALERAEYAHDNDPGSFEEKSLAYIAARRAELAVVYGQYEADRRVRWTADAQYRSREDALRREAEKNAAETRRVLEGTRATLGSVQGNSGQEQQARQNAQSLENARSSVITLDGSALFEANKSELLPSARQTLDEVAKRLKDGTDDVSVLGYGDSPGSDDTNRRLSQERADAVRAYLVERGVAPDRVKAVGRSEAESVASNARSRRVEIVVEKRQSP